ncbi:MAG: SagB/ThcOx family dehydrogenase [Spirochaetes bacterium]|nr:SagB/ThcOx family dehydrogenase [Spirochaetota bacterium]
MNKILPTIVMISLVLASSEQPLFSDARSEIRLLKPNLSGGAPLMVALNRRQSSRSFSRKRLPEQVLSDLLWAAAGINRNDSGKRTAPSSMNRQEIDIYVVLEEGAYRYEPKRHSLKLVQGKDIRRLTGKQAFAGTAPVNLVYVASMSRVAGSGREEKLLYAAADTGFIGQNVYLFCASQGLATVIRAYMDKEALGKALALEAGQEIILAQTVGYPAN